MQFFSCVSGTVFPMLLVFASMFVFLLLSKADAQDEELEETVLKGLTSGKFRIFAVGNVSSKLTLFISSSSDKTDFNGGYQVVEKTEPTDGIFTVTNVTKLAKYTSIVGTNVMFICSDSTGSNLITMNHDGVGALNLGLKKFTELNLTQNQPIVCYDSGSLHLSTNELETYFLVDKSSGKVTMYHFEIETIILASGCSSLNILGSLCILGTQIIITANPCSSPPLVDIISGFVGQDTVYLFDSSNTVYYFDASIFKVVGQSVKLNTVDKAKAWQGPGGLISTKNPHHMAAEEDDSFRFWVGVILLPILILSPIILLLCMCWNCKHVKRKLKYPTGKPIPVDTDNADNDKLNSNNIPLPASSNPNKSPQAGKLLTNQEPNRLTSQNVKRKTNEFRHKKKKTSSKKSKAASTSATVTKKSSARKKTTSSSRRKKSSASKNSQKRDTSSRRRRSSLSKHKKTSKTFSRKKVSGGGSIFKKTSRTNSGKVCSSNSTSANFKRRTRATSH